jgi:hypothetical protein
LTVESRSTKPTTAIIASAPRIVRKVAIVYLLKNDVRPSNSRSHGHLRVFTGSPSLELRVDAVHEEIHGCEGKHNACEEG